MSLSTTTHVAFVVMMTAGIRESIRWWKAVLRFSVIFTDHHYRLLGDYSVPYIVPPALQSSSIELAAAAHPCMPLLKLTLSLLVILKRKALSSINSVHICHHGNSLRAPFFCFFLNHVWFCRFFSCLSGRSILLRIAAVVCHNTRWR